MTTIKNNAIGNSIRAAGIDTNFHEAGEGTPVVLLHGSGVGVSAYANWHKTMPVLAEHGLRAIAPDMVGFGYTECPPAATYSLTFWVDHVIGLLDALGIEKTHLLGNSFGGGVALALTARHPERVARTVLMGSIGTRFTIPAAFNAGFDYQGAKEKVRTLLTNFTYFPESITDEAVDLRYAASTREGYQSTYERLFPGTREQKMLATITPDEQIQAITNEVLLIHGREDKAVPVETSLRLSSMIPRAELHVFNQCGHWSHLDKASRFNRLVTDFYKGV